jgi:hypothetical protein
MAGEKLMGDQRTEAIPLGPNTHEGDIVQFEHQPGKTTYYRAHAKDENGWKRVLLPKWQAEAEIRSQRNHQRLGALCAEAMKR